MDADVEPPLMRTQSLQRLAVAASLLVNCRESAEREKPQRRERRGRAGSADAI